MYIYDYTESTFLKSISWFAAEGRSILEVLTLIQNNKISKSQYKVIGNTLCVGFYNKDNRFLEGHKYWLHLNTEQPYVDILGRHDEEEWFPPSLRLETQVIDESTIQSVFGKKVVLPYVSEEDEYKDEYFADLFDDMFDDDPIDIYLETDNKEICDFDDNISCDYLYESYNYSDSDNYGDEYL
jgi:hypothetical protein